MNYEPSKEAREDCFRAFILPERGLDSPLTSSLIPPCYDESLPSASPTVAGRRRAHTHTRTLNRAAAVPQPSVCEACWCQYRGALSVSQFTGLSASCPLSGSLEQRQTVQKLYLFLFFFPFFLSFVPSPSRSATHIHCSSEVQWDSVVPRRARNAGRPGWLMESGEEKSCICSQVLF